MSVAGRLAKAAGGLGVAAVAAVATGLVVERNVVRTRKAATARVAEMSSLRSEPRSVSTSDGISLYAEIDEVAPYEGKLAKKAARKAARKAGKSVPEITLVFIHGYALNLDCWYFQRDAFRGKYRMAFYDQRSHGRSDASSRSAATIDQLGDDVAAVLDQLVPEGRVILVGHSMGGMSIMAFAERHPEKFAARVAGVALLATTAGDLRPHHILSKLIPDGVGEFMAARLVTALASAPELVDSARQRGSNIGFLAADLMAFGGDAPAEEVEFLDQMLAGTSIRVIGEFFPTFGALDKYAALTRLDEVPCLIVGGGRDRITDVEHSRKMAEAMPRARYVKCAEAGHMVTFEARDVVNAEIEALVERGLR